MSKSANQAVPQPSWKQEVNRRLEAHKSRKGLSVVQECIAQACIAGEEHSTASDRAAMAAARVAARFSKAPSYSEMQASEARAALRDAEVATRAALEAQAVAQAALANFEWANQHAFPDQHVFEDQPQDSEDLWLDTQANSPDSPAAVVPSSAASPAKAFDDAAATASTREFASSVHAEVRSPHLPQPTAIELPQFIEPQPIHANLIHFPDNIPGCFCPIVPSG